MQGVLMEEMSRQLSAGFRAPAAPRGVLKSLLESPVRPGRQEAFSQDVEKEKTLEEERRPPQSAFLGPTLWDKTLPYEGDGFQLEYMDLEEFLTENGIHSQHHQHQHQNQNQPPQRHPPTLTKAPPTSAVMDLRNQASISTHQRVTTPAVFPKAVFPSNCVPLKLCSSKAVFPKAVFL
ncbi:HLF transcription factor, PAR bZIP family member b [Eleginops maclovinus]|uniref:HLF transcription factor, PAR bZIP family member b n=1 Tax=Eleginops maclovinus TaxID=56733 RepID=UPI003080EB93